MEEGHAVPITEYFNAPSYDNHEEKDTPHAMYT